VSIEKEKDLNGGPALEIVDVEANKPRMDVMHTNVDARRKQYRVRLAASRTQHIALPIHYA
jgi:hypothetical protein